MIGADCFKRKFQYLFPLFYNFLNLLLFTFQCKNLNILQSMLILLRRHSFLTCFAIFATFFAHCAAPSGRIVASPALIVAPFSDDDRPRYPSSTSAAGGEQEVFQLALLNCRLIFLNPSLLLTLTIIEHNKKMRHFLQ